MECMKSMLVSGFNPRGEPFLCGLLQAVRANVLQVKKCDNFTHLVKNCFKIQGRMLAWLLRRFFLFCKVFFGV